MLPKGQLSVRGKNRMTIVPVTSHDSSAAEVSWFSALCSDDYQFLGVPDGSLRSSWDHCCSIVKEAEAQELRQGQTLGGRIREGQQLDAELSDGAFGDNHQPSSKHSEM